MSALLHRLRTSPPNRPDAGPVQALEQSGRLCGRQTHDPVFDPWPAKRRVVEPLVDQDQAGAIPNQNLDPVGAFRPEDEGRAAKGIEPQHLLHERRKPIQAFAEVDRLGRNIDPWWNRPENHRRLIESPSITARMTSRPAVTGIRARAPASSSSISPEAATPLSAPAAAPPAVQSATGQTSPAQKRVAAISAPRHGAI